MARTRVTQEVMHDRREIARVLSLMHLQADFRATLVEFREAGAIDDQGGVPFVAVSPSDLVYDVMRMPDPTLPKVVFVTWAEDLEDTVRFVLMTRRDVDESAMPDGVVGLALGTTVREWFAQMDAAIAPGYHAEYVPSTAPEGWTVESARGMAVQAF